jgi:hypothetical protein
MLTDFKKWPLWRLGYYAKYFDVSKILEAMEGQTAPRRLFFWRLPENLRAMTLGQRIQLIKAYERGDLFGATYKILTNVPPLLVYLMPVGLTFPFVGKVLADLKQRAERDKKLVIPLTAEQEAAGLGKMNHGWFGVVDSILVRSQGAYKYEEVENFPDIRVFEILRTDTERALAQRALTEIYNKPKR